MREEEPTADLPLVPQRVRDAVGQVVISLGAMPVVLLEGTEPRLLLELLAVMLLIWTAVVGISRVFFRRPVIRSSDVRRVAGPVVPGRRALGRSWVRSVIAWGILLLMGLGFWALDNLAILPGTVLGIAGVGLLEIRDLRRWEADNDAVLHASAASRGLRPAGPRDTDKLVAVIGPRAGDALATLGDRS